MARMAALSPQEKMAQLADLNAMALQLARSGIRQRHPGASDAVVERLLADLLLGPELARAVFGELPAGAL